MASTTNQSHSTSERIYLGNIKWNIYIDCLKSPKGQTLEIKTVLWCDHDQLSGYLTGLFSKARAFKGIQYPTNIPCIRTEKGLGFLKSDIDKWFLNLEKKSLRRETIYLSSRAKV